MKKLYHVNVTFEVDLVALALNREEAEIIGRNNWREEMRNAGTSPDCIRAEEVKTRNKIERILDAEDLEHVTPYGSEHEPSPQLSIAEYCKQLGIE